MVAEMTNQQWALIGIGGALFLFGIVAVVMGMLSRRKLTAISGTSTSTVAQAAGGAGAVPGAQVELKGVSEGRPALTSPATNTQCLYFKHKVEGLRVRMERDDKGNMHRREEWDKVFEDERSTPFILRDDSGAIVVAPDGAEFVPVISMNDQSGAFGYDVPQESVTAQVLDTVLDAVTHDDDYEHYERYRTSEWIVPAGQQCYVLGSVTGQGEGAQVSKGGGRFIISCKSEEELSRKYKWHFMLWWLFGVLSLAGGAGLAIFGAVKK
jgi:hypothetical protein